MSVLHSSFYRGKQFFKNLTAGPLSLSAEKQIKAVLQSKELDLFNSFSHSDKWHSYRVWDTLQAAGESQSDLAVAALLHDVGKTHVHLKIWERVIAVLGGKVVPQKTSVWGQGAVESWKRPFVVKTQHATWGADMAAAAGCTPLTVNLIRRHQDIIPLHSVDEEDKLLILLQWADDQN